MQQAYPNHAKSQLAAGKMALGMILRQARTAEIASIAKICGFDWLSIDREHGAMGLETAAMIVAAALPLGITPLVRVSSIHDPAVTPLLDAGAQGLIVSDLEDAQDAARAVQVAKYAPLGRRSIAGPLPHLRFANVPGPQARAQVNDTTLLAVMIESRRGLEQVAAIAATPGVDVVLVGIHDLCEALGVPGDFGHRKVEEAFRAVTRACLEAGIHAGMSGIQDPALARKFLDLGVRFVGGGTDQSLLMAAAQQRAALMRGLLA